MFSNPNIRMLLFRQMYVGRVASQDGFVYVDGEHSQHAVQLGDELQVSADAPPLYLYAGESQPYSSGENGQPSSAPWRHL